MSIYSPNLPIAIASSFEGIVNDGAPECALTSLNAYHNMNPGAFFGRKITAREFIDQFRSTEEVQLFVALRPLVAVAEDYHTVLELVRHHRDAVMVYANNPFDVKAYDAVESLFDETKNRTQAERTTFGKDPKTSHFYQERNALKSADKVAWNNTNAPYADTMPQFRDLSNTIVTSNGLILGGFVPFFATSKDEISTYELCLDYTKMGSLNSGDVETEDKESKCVISRDRIVGIAKVPSKNKKDQCIKVQKILDELAADTITRAHVWRINDRYDKKEQEELFDNGFMTQFFMPGYATPLDVQQAQQDKMVRVLDRKHFAEQLAAYAEQWGF